MTEEEYIDAQDEYGEENFRAGIGAEALKEVLSELDLEEEKANAEEELAETVPKPSVRSWLSVLSCWMPFESGTFQNG